MHRAHPRATSGKSDPQLGLFGAAPEHPLLDELRALDPERMTPMDALAPVVGVAQAVGERLEFLGRRRAACTSCLAGRKTTEPASRAPPAMHQA
jgi:hypothetical protein